MVGIDEIRAKDVMTKNLISAGKEDTVSDAIGLMKKHDVSEIVITDENDEFIGMITEDMFIERRHLPLSTKLMNAMNPATSVDENDSIIEVCERLLSSGYRGVPVMSNQKECIGFVSRTDIVNNIPRIEDIKNSLVQEVMTPAPTTLREHETISHARNIMNDMDEKVLPVVDKYGKLSGMIGIKDIVENSTRPKKREEKGDRAGERDSPYEDLEVWSIMSTPPITTSPKESVHNAAKKMSKNQISTLVAIDGGDIKGILSQIDLIEMIASFREGDRTYVQITGLDDGPETFDAMYDIIQKYLKKFNQVVKPLVMNIHVVTHQTEGEETKYSIRLRLQTDHGMFYTKEFDWNIMRALDDGLENMRRKIFQEKEKLLDKYHKHPKYRGE
ncbi:MAG: CBS domain-containing protein [Thermoplasmata archaeon]